MNLSKFSHEHFNGFLENIMHICLKLYGNAQSKDFLERKFADKQQQPDAK